MKKDEDKTKEQLINELKKRQKQLERELTKQKATYQGLVDEAGIGIATTDLRGRFTFANETLCEIMGYSQNELIGKQFGKFLHPDDKKGILKIFCNVPKYIGKRLSLEFRVIHKKGHYIWMHSRPTSTWGKGKIIGFNAIIENITERKQTEKILLESEDKYRKLFELGSDALFLIEVKTGRILDLNDTALKMYGYSREEALQMKNTDFSAESRQTRQATIEHKQQIPVRYHRKKDGTIFAADISVAYYTWYGKEVCVAAIRDITERKNAEKALRETEERYHALVDLGGTIGQAIIMRQDTEQGEAIQTFVSDEWSLITGYSREELLGMPFLDLLHPKYRKASLERQRRKIKGEIIPEFFEMSIIRKDGTEVPIELTSAYTTYKGKRGTVAYIRDITERKRAEEEIARLAKFPSENPNPVMRVAQNGTILYANRAALPLLNEWRCQTGQPLPDYWHKLVLDVLNSGLKKDAEVELGNRLFSLTFAPVVDAGYVNLYGLDITERKRAEEMLMKSERKYRKLYETAPVMLYTLDRKGVVLDCNKALLETFGRSKEEMIGKPIYDFQKEESRKHAPIDLAKVAREGSVRGERDIITKDGKVITIGFSAYMEYDEERGETVIKSVARDITERKQAEERERKLQQELQIASRLATVGEMAAGIAHEINNPLTGVIGFTGLLMKKDIPDDIRRDVEIIYEGAQRVASITRRLLTFARRQEQELEHVNINDVIETTFAMRAYEMESSNITITTELDPELPWTIADASQLQQVFLNIILNAETEMITAHGGGNLLVKTERMDDTIQVSIKDDGPGIAKKNLEKIFDPFFTTRDVGRGAGLGLSVCHGIITGHGGKIYAESKLGKGATFIVELPIVTKAKQLELAEPAAAESKRISGARILVVDDDTIVQQFLTEILSEERHKVEIIENGDEALERLKSEDYDVILLDVKLPGISGIDIYKHLQKRAKSLARRVVFITGDVMGRETMAFLSRTRAPYITKPFDANQCKKEINRILSQQS